MTKVQGITPDWPAPANVRSYISTRAGGVSASPYASNNLGLHVGDDSDAVAKNRAQLSDELGLTQSPQWLEQVHGVKVVNAKSDGVVRTADGSYSDQSGQACLVMTADCLPILLCDKQGTQVAALHCGWRSLAKGICARGLQKFTAKPGDILAYLGPAISQPHFEVGIDVLEAFFKAARNQDHAEQIAKAFVSAQRPLHFYADIYALARAELNALGVTAIYGGGYCTYADEARFYSFRRDKVTGRMASLIWRE
ncbi:MAG: peptidoglycan editing factor PgeF [Cellvibrio sp.]|uniref:peptidoglycan editing factor PgeF n=1 Tax=Cellvibrio sp. TaxID=1965322 RepID=UPI0031ADBE98